MLMRIEKSRRRSPGGIRMASQSRPEAHQRSFYAGEWITLFCLIVSLDGGEFNVVSNGIEEEEAWTVRDGVGLYDLAAGLDQSLAVLFHVVYFEAEMACFGWMGKIGVRDKMQLHFTIAGGKPDQTTMS